MEKLITILCELEQHNISILAAKWEILNLLAPEKQSMPCKPPKFKDWLSMNFTRRTIFYYDRINDNAIFSIKEIESQYVMKFSTDINSY